MSVNIYDGTNDELNQIAGREDTSYWEGTQAQWNALSSADKALWTGKYVIITDDEESVNKYNGTELINIAGKGANGDTKDCITTFTSSDDSTESGLILPSGGDITVPQIVSGDTHGNLFSGLSKVVLNTRKLINTVKRIWKSVGATWVSGHAYAVNDMVVYENGHVYKCKAAHTSSASILPTNTTYWTDTTLANEIASLNTNYANNYKLLWTNNNVNVAFPAQTIQLDLSSYKAINIVLSNWKGNSNVFSSFQIPIGRGSRCAVLDGLDHQMTVVQFAYRSVYPSSSGVQFGGGFSINSIGNQGADDSYAFPRYIYGVN